MNADFLRVHQECLSYCPFRQSILTNSFLSAPNTYVSIESIQVAVSSGPAPLPEEAGAETEMKKVICIVPRILLDYSIIFKSEMGRL